jgi:hypothetical protein
VTPERRAQLALQALKEIAAFRVRLAQQAPSGLWDLLACKVCKAWLDRWEQRERRALRGLKA